MTQPRSLSAAAIRECSAEPSGSAAWQLLLWPRHPAGLSGEGVGVAEGAYVSKATATERRHQARMALSAHR